MIDFVNKNCCYDFVPEIWSNFVEFRAKRSFDFCSNFIDSILSVMVQYNDGNSEVLNDKRFLCIIKQIFSLFLNTEQLLKRL